MNLYETMNLHDGLKKYKTQPNFNLLTDKVEKSAIEVLSLLEKYKNKPDKEALKKAKQFLIEVEEWKVDCLQQGMGNAVRNTENDIWDSIYYAKQGYDKKNDPLTLKPIMNLRGFGSLYDDETRQRRAKVATAALRFLWPIDWGVVDWRNAAIIGFLEKNNWDYDLALKDAENSSANELKSLFDIIDEHAAIEYNKIYRNKCSLDLKRAADIDMALFGLSLFVWPLQKNKFSTGQEIN